MKRYGKLYPEIIAFNNVLSASEKARKGKRFINSTARFELNLEDNLFKIINDLKNKTYTPGKFKDFFIYDPKKRLISAAPYYDRVIHHAIMNIVDPLITPSYIQDSYACIKGKGVHEAVKRYKQFQTNNQYVLKCDIKKYFQSINHIILFKKLEHKIKCKDTLWLFKKIIDSKEDKGNFEYFPGDNLFTPIEQKKGIPIGNLTSQFFANLYLNGFDHFMKQKIKAKAYIRYCDDFVIFGNDKKLLNQIKNEIKWQLEELRLLFHAKKTRIFKVTDGVNFLGYRIWPDHTKVRKSTVKAYRRRIKKLSEDYSKRKIQLDRITASIKSWIGHVDHADSGGLKRDIISGIRLIKPPEL